jgi:hypothetical protein
MKQAIRKTTLLRCAIAALLSVAFICCSSQKPEKVAEDFLNAYFEANYEGAAKFCTPELGNDLLKALEQTQALDEPIRANIQKYTKFYKPQVIKTQQPSKKDSIIVNYIVTNTAADSLAPGRQIKESRVHIVKTEDGWKVSALK